MYLASVQLLVEGMSFFTISGLKFVLFKNYLTILLALVTFYFTFKLYRFSQLILLALAIVVTLKGFLSLSSSFNKLALAFNFIYLMFAFFFYTDWELFLDSASSSPNYSELDLEKQTRFPILGKFIQGSEEVIFHLTNLDEKGCFVLFENVDDFKLGTKGFIKINYEMVEFSSEVECVTLYDKGAGFNYISQNSRRDLSGLYQVCLERGIFN